jgi:hypothetical protein
MSSKYESDEEFVDRNLDMKARTIYNISKTKALVKITVKEFIQCVGNWIYNREIDVNKVKELKEQYMANNGNDYFNIMDNDKENDISPAWIISIVYDKEATGVHNLFVIDGQHRREVIRELLEEGLIWDTIEIVCIMYSIDNCYKQNKKTTLELFKKINNNLQLKDTDFPKILATQVVEAIEKEKELAPQTIKNSLYDIKSCSFWYLMIFQKTPNVEEIWIPLDKLITNCCLKENKRDRKLKSAGQSIESAIADRRWPVNGLKELQHSCVNEIAKYNDMNTETFIDERFYNEFLKLLYATYYVFNIQGRVGAFTALTYAQGGEMVHTGTVPRLSS